MFTSALITGSIATWAGTHVASLALTHAFHAFSESSRWAREAEQKRREEAAFEKALKFLQDNKPTESVSQPAWSPKSK